MSDSAVFEFPEVLGRDPLRRDCFRLVFGGFAKYVFTAE